MKRFLFGLIDETAWTVHRENATAVVYSTTNTTADQYESLRIALEYGGWQLKQSYNTEHQYFSAYSKGQDAAFLNYFPTTKELRAVEETDCRYFTYTDAKLPRVAEPQITQLYLEDFGMSYAIRLSDGRFIVIDGGREFEPDATRLLACLKEGSPTETPVIAAWIMSHPHSDHFHCFLKFMELYADEVTIEKFLLNFPEADDTEHYPKFSREDPRFEDSSPMANIPKMWAWIRQTEAPVYMLHTGQRYRIGDATCRILSTMDDTIHVSDNINAISTVIRMELGGQVILWATDASFSIAKLPERYGEELKADILQVPHHGFQSGSAEGEIAGYELIRPKVCLLAVSAYNAYTVFCTYRRGTRYLMEQLGIEELITGTPQRTITLPYTAPAFAREELRRQYLGGLARSGADTWIFTDLNTDCREDFVFTALNTTMEKVTVWAELFFEDSKQNLRYIQTELPVLSVKRIDLLGEDMNHEAVYFNTMSLAKRGLPEHALFAVRFICTQPTVITHATHKASYHTAAPHGGRFEI